MTKDELIRVIEDEANQLDRWVQKTRDGGWSTQHVDAMRERADYLRRVASQAKLAGITF